MKTKRKYRFVEYEDDIWLIVGIGYNSEKRADVFEIVPLFQNNNINRASISVDSVQVEIDEVTEIEDKNTLESIFILYSL